MKNGRIYVLYGQFSWLGSSLGMSSLANRIKQRYPGSIVSTHDWKYGPRDVVADIALQPLGVPTIPIGYSLGANGVLRIAASFDVSQSTRSIKRRIFELCVCYDPSQLGEKVLDPETGEAPSNIKRLLLYHNNSPEPWGHWLIPGKQVEITETYTSHLRVCYLEALHQKTLAAIDGVLGYGEKEK